MFILQKKRILIVFTCLMISTFIFKVKDSKRNIIQETVALPCNKKTIVIDAGHGGEDGGATVDNRDF